MHVYILSHVFHREVRRFFFGPVMNNLTIFVPDRNSPILFLNCSGLTLAPVYDLYMVLAVGFVEYLSIK